MDIHGENSFKARSYSVAAYKIDQLTTPLENLTQAKIFALDGIGDAIGKKIFELLKTGKIKLLDDLLEKTPPGILEMMNIKGLGPKKINVIWKEMNIENIGELLYACHENRLALYKGFGEKTQNNIISAIEFYQKRHGHFLYAQVVVIASELETLLSKIFGKKIFITGAFKRQEETIDQLEFVVPSNAGTIKSKLSSKKDFTLVEEDPKSLLFQFDAGIKVRLYPTTDKKLTETIFFTTGADEFNNAFKKAYDSLDFSGFKDEEAVFRKLKLQSIPPPLRESGKILEKAEDFSIPDLIEPEDIKGIIHCHSNWSDGVESIETLAKAALKKGFEYLVISDHSKAAFYANGLTEEKIRAQHELVDELNVKLAPFKIFKSIESDILNDGNLDYSDKLLSTFDLVIASVHSNLKMGEEKAMIRLLKVIENPFTTILGHMTGRLLLSRAGFPVDYKKIIDACSKNHVAIELNAHPRRLDMKWQWIEYALSKNVLISINPDAHSIEEFDNIRYGVLAAQKGMLSKEKNLSSFTLAEFEKYLKDTRKKKKLSR